MQAYTNPMKNTYLDMEKRIICGLQLFKAEAWDLFV